MRKVSEIEQLTKEIEALEAQLEPKQVRLNKLYQKQSEDVKARKQLAYQGKKYFKSEELRYAAYKRCLCGAGLAYPKDIGIDGSWDCSDILLGKAIPANQPGSKEHTAELPFMFYEIKSEDQPSANGTTTRISLSPKEKEEVGK